MDYHFQKGWIELICGSMFAGKSEELIRRIQRIKYAKKKIQAFKPVVDNRYAIDEIVSHDNNRVKSICITKASDIIQFLDSDTYAIAIDEVQFLDMGIIEVAEELADKGIRVILAGLDKDFRGEPFGPMPFLLARAEHILKLTAICTVCGGPATRSQRLVNGEEAKYDEPLIILGAKEAYEPRCRHCHKIVK
ncbi:MAG: thymidine kinase [Erysipelotrichales bacterium]|nr:thymidine kinase [Erysipelotrichales bacterium]